MSRSRPNSFKRLSKVPLEVVKESSPAAVAGMSSTESSGVGAACTDSVLRRISEKMLSSFMMMPVANHPFTMRDVRICLELKC